MKSFLGFLKESSSLIEEGVFIGEDVPIGKYTATKQNKRLIGSDTKQGFYLYFVEYASLNKEGQTNIYFGIKYKPGSEGDPDLFWGSLRTQNSMLNRPIKKSTWDDFVVKCNDSETCKPENENIVKPGNIYMSSASAQTPESLPRTIFYGLTDPSKQKFHPWIINTTTLKYVKKAAGKGEKNIKVYPIAKDRNSRFPRGSEYAYKIYVLDDMNKLQELLTKIRKNSKGLPTEVKNFFKEAEENKKYMKDVLIKENANEFIDKFYSSIESYYKDKKIPSELSNKNLYLNFLKKSIEKNTWVLVGTFESLATIMMDKLINESKDSPYKHLHDLYNKKTDTGVAFQVKSTQKIINFKPELFDVYFPPSMSKEEKEELGAYITGEDAGDLREREKKKKEEELRKIETQKKREMKSKLMFVPMSADFYVDDVATNFVEDIVKMVNNNDNGLRDKLAKYFIDTGLKDIVDSFNKPLHNLYIKSGEGIVYLKQPAPRTAGEERNNNKKVTKLEPLPIEKARRMTESEPDLVRRLYTLYDFMNNVFDYSDVKYKKFNTSTFWYNDLIKKLKSPSFTKEKETQQDVTESILEEADSSKVDKAAFEHVFKILNTSKNPYRNIFFQFNDKVSQLNKKNLKEDANKNVDNSLEKLQKLVILSTDFGTTHQNLSNK